jgi:hypothetical protein
MVRPAVRQAHGHEQRRMAHHPEQSRRTISKFEFSNYLKKVLDIGHLEFGFVSSFDIRISDFDLLFGDAKTFARLCEEFLGRTTS